MFYKCEQWVSFISSCSSKFSNFCLNWIIDTVYALFLYPLMHLKCIHFFLIFSFFGDWFRDGKYSICHNYSLVKEEENCKTLGATTFQVYEQHGWLCEIDSWYTLCSLWIIPEKKSPQLNKKKKKNSHNLDIYSSIEVSYHWAQQSAWKKM